MFDVSKQQLQPIADPNDLVIKKGDDKGELIRIRYATGFPVKYNFDLSNGTFGELKGTRISDDSDDVQFIPLAYRHFNAALFGQAEMKYVEVYFLNHAGWLCQMMLHKHNAEAFLEMVLKAQHLHDYQLGQYGIKVRLKSKTITTSDGTVATYYICTFKGFELDKEQQQILKCAFENITTPIYREDICDPAIETLCGENWNLQPDQTETPEEFIIGQQEAKQLPNPESVTA